MKAARVSCLFVITYWALGQPPLSPDDRFVIRTAQANLAEVQMSAWAKDHALSDEVRKFAGKVVNDHTVLADELRSLAVKQSAAPVADLDPKDAAEIEHMKTLEPNLLDREYMREVMRWHLKEAEAFKREVETGKDAGLRYWAYQMQPKIQAYIRLGEDTERAIGMEVAERVAANTNQ
jgi:putative membrane protein